jgi:hypothetical protein
MAHILDRLGFRTRVGSPLAGGAAWATERGLRHTQPPSSQPSSLSRP